MVTNLIMAKFAIAKAKQASTTEKILAEILNTEGNIIYNPTDLSPTICHKIKITPVNFRKHILILYKLNLIRKHGNAIIINPTIRKAFKK